MLGKQHVLNHLKNIVGWKTKRKIIVFSVDDYGNVRVDSNSARGAMMKAGLDMSSRFDAFDTLETVEDLEVLYEALSSVRDKNGRHAVFTPFAMPCNINFERMAEDDYKVYHYELLPDTFNKLKGYEKAWPLWKEGIEKRILLPEFHGREHLNLKVFKEKLQARDHQVLTALKNRSYAGVSHTGYSTISMSAAFQFWDPEENNAFEHIIKDGLNRFEQVFGYKSVHFNAPGGSEHPVIHKYLKEGGVKYIDAPLIKYEHQGFGKYRRVFNHTGRKNNLGQTFLVRNVIFEPNMERGFDWPEYAFSQIEAAFFWNQPAIISSHRVNFCGYLDENNRKKGISDLRKLLQKIVARWPEVEFLSVSELGDQIMQGNS